MATSIKLVDRAPAPPVNAAGGVEPDPIPFIMLLDVLLLIVLLVDVELMAAQDVKFWLPNKTPTLCASVICSMWRMAVAVDTFVAQKLTVKLKEVAVPLQMGVAIVPS